MGSPVRTCDTPSVIHFGWLVHQVVIEELPHVTLWKGPGGSEPGGQAGAVRSGCRSAVSRGCCTCTVTGGVQAELCVIQQSFPHSPTMRNPLRPVYLACVTAHVTLLACAAAASGPVALDGKLPLGSWGGDNAGMIVGDTAMHLHVGCTYGDVSGRIELAADGSFDVAGSYMLRAYPIAVGPSVPARFRGHLDGAFAVVTVTVNDTVQRATVVKGPVTVKFGDQPRLGPCPICRRPIITIRQP